MFRKARLVVMDSVHDGSVDPTPAVGDFYVENACCTRCGVPELVAPDLIGIRGDGHCFWKKQPVTPDEMQQTFAIFDGQELGCHRYAGINPEIQKRIGFEQCDTPVNGATQNVSVVWPSGGNGSQSEVTSPSTIAHKGLLARILSKLRGDTY